MFETLHPFRAALAASFLLMAGGAAALGQTATPTVAAGGTTTTVTVVPAATAAAPSVAPVAAAPSTTFGNTIPGSSSGTPVTVKVKIKEAPGSAPAAAPEAPSKPAKPAASDETASITMPAAPPATATAPAAPQAKPAVAAVPGKLKNCVRLGFSVNDYGKAGPTKDAIRLFEKFVPKWAEFNKIKTYKVGKQDVTCKLFLDFIVFDEHTCRAEADVCWNGTPKPEDTNCPGGTDCE